MSTRCTAPSRDQALPVSITGPAGRTLRRVKKYGIPGRTISERTEGFAVFLQDSYAKSEHS
jgi:hypothetical protein